MLLDDKPVAQDDTSSEITDKPDAKTGKVRLNHAFYWLVLNYFQSSPCRLFILICLLVCCRSFNRNLFISDVSLFNC